MQEQANHTNQTSDPLSNKEACSPHHPDKNLLDMLQQAKQEGWSEFEYPPELLDYSEGNQFIDELPEEIWDLVLLKRLRLDNMRTRTDSRHHTPTKTLVSLPSNISKLVN